MLRSTECPPSSEVVIVGAGFCGVLTAVNLLRSDTPPNILLIERAERRAPGVAFGNCDPTHLLNVRAKQMGAFPDAPGDFYEWLQQQYHGQFGPDDFAPRALYGEYLNSLLVAASERHPGRIRRITDVVLQVSPEPQLGPQGILLTLGSGRTCIAETLALAIGLPQAAPPWKVAASAAQFPQIPVSTLIADPWQPDSLEQITSDVAEIVIFGSGLTALDIVASLHRRGHRGNITLLSRRGQLPFAHSSTASPAKQYSWEVFDKKSPLEVFRFLRRESKTALEQGDAWQSVIDGVRPHTVRLWQSWAVSQRRQFLRLLRRHWEAVRHRAPSELMNLIDERTQQGLLTIKRGRARTIQPTSDCRIEVPLPSGETLVADHLINCTGFVSSIGASLDPLLSQLLRDGVLTPDELGMGIQTDVDGVVHPQVVLLGALRRAGEWEATAVPELRAHAFHAARSLERMLGG